MLCQALLASVKDWHAALIGSVRVKKRALVSQSMQRLKIDPTLCQGVQLFNNISYSHGTPFCRDMYGPFGYQNKYSNGPYISKQSVWFSTFFFWPAAGLFTAITGI